LNFQDALITQILLKEQIIHKCVGNFLEIGTYQGKYTLLCGRFFSNQTEVLFLNDVFNSLGEVSLDNKAEILSSYGSLSKATLLKNLEIYEFRNFKILEMSSINLNPKDFDSTFRFIHIDGSHQFNNVKKDLEFSSQVIDKDRGIIVVDDYRATHTPGVSKAIWASEVEKELIPLILGPTKVYFVPKESNWDLNRIHSLLAQYGIQVKKIKDFNQEMICVTNTDKSLYFVQSVINRLRKLSLRYPNV
jgi:hypothetical protein